MFKVSGLNVSIGPIPIIRMAAETQDKERNLRQKEAVEGPP